MKRGPVTTSRLSKQSTRKRRASQYIEFAILLPIFIVILLFIIDAGQMVLVQAGLQDAAQQIARTGAQQGGLGPECQTGTSCTSGAIYNELVTAIDAIPGGNGANLDSSRPIVAVSGGGTYGCTTASPYVTVQVNYNDQLVFPGIKAILTTIDPSWELHASATARCEISLTPGA